MGGLYVGTEKGLHVLSEAAGGWRVDRTILGEYEISAVVKRDGGKALLVGTRQAGLFKVDPNAGTFEPVATSVLPKGIRCLAVSPRDPNTLFIGCEPVAILKSTDGGRTWTDCPAVKKLAERRNWKYPVPSIPPHIRHILVDRVDPQRVYASGQIGGVLRSEDGGTTWNDVTADLDPDVHAIAQDPKDPDVLYASTGGGGYVGVAHPPAPYGFPLYRSEDSGKTWRCISSDFTRRHSVPLHVYPKEPATLVAATALDNPGQWSKRPEGADAILLVSRDSGGSWQQVSDGLPKTFPIMVEAIETDVTDTGRVYIGIGGEGTKVLPVEKRAGAVYYADRLEGPWQRLPKDFPVVFTVTSA